MNNKLKEVFKGKVVSQWGQSQWGQVLYCNISCDMLCVWPDL
jgi:hypothetical protein